MDHRAPWLIGLVLLALAVGSTTVAAPPERSTDGDEELLPIDLTPAERALVARTPRAWAENDPPPVGPIRNVAEFEPCTGVLIRYPLGISYSLIKELTEDVTLFVIVSSANVNTAITNFLAQGVDTTRVDFIVEPNNSIWTRDYGPWFVFDGNGDQVILDHYYNRPARPDDDKIPIALGARWGIPVVTHDLWHTGGNYMTEGHGLSYSTRLVWYENEPMTPDEIAQFMLDYYGVDTYNVLPDIALNGIRHIDTWAKLLDEETVLMKQVLPSHPDYDRIEANVATVQGLTNKYGRPFRVVRVFCPPIPSGNVAAYTNSLILNNKVLVPTFGLPADDVVAVMTYRAAMPGYEVLGFSGSWVTDDALHCRVMGIHDRYMLRVDHDPLQGASPGVPIKVTMYADPRSEERLEIPETAVYWRVVGAPAFEKVEFHSDDEPDWYRAYIPEQAPGTEIEYYVTARDLTGRVASRPRTAPAATYHVTVDGATAVHPAPTPKLSLAVAPSPFRYRTTARLDLARAATARVVVYDVRGREVVRLLDRSLGAGEHQVEWSGRDAKGAPAPSGVYFVVLKSGSERVTQRVLLLR
jgi:agmatine deiminase